VKQSIQRALSGETFTSTLWVNEHLFECHFSPLTDATGKLNGTICLSIDITQSYQLQQEIIKKQRLASLGELAAGVAHEINNPNGLVLLNSRELVKIFADIAPILNDHYQSGGDFKLGTLSYSEIQEDLPQLLEHIVESAQRIKTIVSDLKDFSRTDISPHPEVVDLNHVVTSALPFIESLIKVSTENFSVIYSPEALPVKCFSKRLEQVIINLVQNSCQALSDPTAKITLKLMHDEEQQTQILKIEDEGCGISAENLRHIKEPFFTTRRNDGGTGLGLSVSTQMIEECSGTLEFLSTQGVGTTAILSFPANHEEVTP
jgi:signal transduction histidine kinase